MLTGTSRYAELSDRDDDRCTLQHPKGSEHIGSEPTVVSVGVLSHLWMLLARQR